LNKMKISLTARRCLEAFALFLIGDGIMGLIKPRWHSLLWDFGPEPIQDFTEALARNPNIARAIYAAEAAAGIAIAAVQTREDP
jgi:hypothetical protein